MEACPFLFFLLFHLDVKAVGVVRMFLVVYCITALLYTYKKYIVTNECFKSNKVESWPSWNGCVL